MGKEFKPSCQLERYLMAKFLSINSQNTRNIPATPAASHPSVVCRREKRKQKDQNSFSGAIITLRTKEATTQVWPHQLSFRSPIRIDATGKHALTWPESFRSDPTGSIPRPDLWETNSQAPLELWTLAADDDGDGKLTNASAARTPHPASEGAPPSQHQSDLENSRARRPAMASDVDLLRVGHDELFCPDRRMKPTWPVSDLSPFNRPIAVPKFPR